MKQKEWIMVIIAMVVVAIIVSILTFVVMNKVSPSLSPTVTVGGQQVLTIEGLYTYLPGFFYNKTQVDYNIKASETSSTNKINQVKSSISYLSRVQDGQTMSVEMANNHNYNIRTAYISDTSCILCISINGGSEQLCDRKLVKGSQVQLSDYSVLEVTQINYRGKSGGPDSVEFNLRI